MTDIHEVLPHGPGAILISGVSVIDGPRIECVGRVPASSPFVRDGIAGAWVAAEMGAQAAGLHQAFAQGTGLAPRRIEGFLARIRHLVLHAPVLPVDAPLTVSACLEGQALGFAAWAIRVDDGTKPLASGTITTFLRNK